MEIEWTAINHRTATPDQQRTALKGASKADSQESEVDQQTSNQLNSQTPFSSSTTMNSMEHGPGGSLMIDHLPL